MLPQQYIFYLSRVRPPPYRQVASECAASADRAHVSANNLCGDLNRGIIPHNPMGQSPNGEPYPLWVNYTNNILPTEYNNDLQQRNFMISKYPKLFCSQYLQINILQINITQVRFTKTAEIFTLPPTNNTAFHFQK